MSQLYDILEKATGITCDSRLVKSGNIFVAIKGRCTDGNLYALEAQRRGACALVTDSLPPKVDIPVFVTPNPRHTLAEMAARFYGHPSEKLSLIGVTGTNGKTTVTYMLEHIFNSAGYKAGLIGTVKVNTGARSFASSLTTPDAVSIQSYLSEMLRNNVTHAAMEVSAQGVEMHRADNLKFACGIITNITPDHLDFHGNFENYLIAKKQFIKLLANDTPLVINVDDEYCREIAEEYKGPIVTASLKTEADFSAREVMLTPVGSRFKLTLKNTSSDINIPVCMQITGLHNIENAVMASAAAYSAGIHPDIIASALSRFSGVERRMNIFHISGLTVIDDTALNPGSIDAVLNTLSGFRYSNITVIDAIRGQRGCAINKANAAKLADWQNKLHYKLLITSSIGNVGVMDTVSHAEKSAFLSTLDELDANYTYYAGLEAAISNALYNCQCGELLVLLGAQGMDEGRKVLTALVSEQKRPADEKVFNFFADAL